MSQSNWSPTEICGSAALIDGTNFVARNMFAAADLASSGDIASAAPSYAGALRGVPHTQQGWEGATAVPWRPQKAASLSESPPAREMDEHSSEDIPITHISMIPDRVQPVNLNDNEVISPSLPNEDNECMQMPSTSAAASDTGRNKSGIKAKVGKCVPSIPVRKSQLTPRMALYIPPHLQKQTQQAAVPDAASPSKSSKREKRKQHLLTTVRLSILDYQQKQFNVKVNSCISRKKSKEISGNTNNCKSTTCISQPRLSEELWTAEMASLLAIRKDCHESYIKTGCGTALKKSKLSKIQLRSLLRKARSQNKVLNNPCKMFRQTRENHENSANTNVGDINPTILTDIEPSSSLDVQYEYDGSFFFSVLQRHQARTEWSEAIMMNHRSAPSLNRSSSGVIKVEIIDTDSESDANESSVSECVSKSPKVLHEKCATSTTATEASRNTKHNAPARVSNDSSLDSSNNEYLNQQFLRRQHDYEREQKYHQIGLESKSKEFMSMRNDNSFEDVNFIRNPDMFNYSLRRYNFEQLQPIYNSSQRSIIEGSDLAANVASVHNYDEVPSPYGEPLEPFISSRRHKGQYPDVLEQGPEKSEQVRVNNMLQKMYGDAQFGLRKRSLSPQYNRSDTDTMANQVCKKRKTSPAHGPSSSAYWAPHEASPEVRNYCSNEDVCSVANSYTNKMKSTARELSPYSDRIKGRELNINNCRTNNIEKKRELSPYSDRMSGRDHATRQVSPFSDRIRSSEQSLKRRSPFRNCMRQSDNTGDPLELVTRSREKASRQLSPFSERSSMRNAQFRKTAATNNSSQSATPQNAHQGRPMRSANETESRNNAYSRHESRSGRPDGATFGSRQVSDQRTNYRDECEQRRDWGEVSQLEKRPAGDNYDRRRESSVGRNPYKDTEGRHGSVNSHSRSEKDNSRYPSSFKSPLARREKEKGSNRNYVRN